MATRISGITIKLDGDGTKLNSALKSVDSQIKTTQNSLRDVGRLLKLDPGNTELLSQKQKNLASAITATKDRLEQLKNVSREGLSDEKWDALQREIIATEQDLKKLQEEYKEFGSVSQQQIIAAGKRMEEAGGKIEEVGNKIAGVGNTLTTHLTLPIAALGTAAVKVAADFEEGMDKVQAISGASASEMEALTEKAKEMGETTTFSARESADALSYMAMAGWKTEDMLNGIEGVMNLAAASGADLATTSDIVTDALTAFGEGAEEAGHLADVMAAASANANTNVEMMGETFKYAAPIAGTLGVSMEDMAIATGLMANASVKASNAGTALRTGLTRLAAPPKAAREALNKYSIETTDTAGNMLSLRDIMENVRSALGDLSTTEQTAALNAIFGKNAISGWAAVLNATEEDFNRLSSAIDGSSGAAKSMADTMKDNLKGELTMLKSQIESIGIDFGDIIMPTIKDVVKGIGNVVKRLKKLSPETKDMIVKLGMFTAAAGPVIAIGGKLISGIGKIVKGVGSFVQTVPQAIAKLTAQTVATEGATVAQAGLNAAMYAMPIVAVAAGIGALVAAISQMEKAADESVREVTGVGEAIENADAANQSAIEHMNSYAESLRSVRTETEATATQAESAANTLKEIGDSGDKSSTDLARMSVAVQQLNQLFPDLGLELDRSTGKLNKSQDEIEKYIASAKKMGQIEQAANLVQASLDQVATATQDLAYEQATLDAMLEKQEGLTKQAESFDQLYTNLMQGKISLDEYRTSVEELAGPVEWMYGEVFKMGEYSYNAAEYSRQLTERTNELGDAIEDQRGVIDATNQSLEIAQSTADQLQESHDKLKASVEAETEANHRQAESMDLSILKVDEAVMAWERLGPEMQETALKAAEAMTTLQSNVESALSSQMNMFEEFNAGSAMSTDQLIANMQSQVEGVRNWESNLKELAERGIDQDLLQKLAEMGPQGSGYVETFKNMTADQMKEANALWKEGLNIQQFGNDEALELQTAIGQMAVGSEAGFTQLGEALGLQANTAGQYTGKGLIEGLETLQEAVNAAGTETGDELIESLNTALGVHSPSTITTQSGKDVDQGLANGLDQGKYFILSACSQVKATMNSSLITPLNNMSTQAQAAGQKIGQGLANGINSMRGNVANSITAINSAVQQGQNQIQAQVPQWQNIGQMISMGLAAGIMAGQSAVINAVTAVAASAITAAMSALQIGSPSKVADKMIGRNFDAGIVQGIEKGTHEVLGSIDRLTNAMVDVPGRSFGLEAMAGSGSTTNYDYGGTVINVYGAEGQDVNRLAEVVEERLNASYARRQAAWARG